MEGQNVAIYLDFENLAISAETVYPSRDKPLEMEPILDFAATKGVLRIKKAYADWSKQIFAQYQSRLIEFGFELVHLPETNFQGKNGSDVRLAIDVMENLEFYSTVNTYIIGSGDTDFIPLIQRLKMRGMNVVVMGFEHSVGRLVKRNSSEFKSLEELIGAPEDDSPTSDLSEAPDKSYGRNLLWRYLKTRGEDEPILMAKLKQHLLRLDPSFSEKELGFTSFKHFLQSMTGDLVDRIDTENPSLPVVFLSQVDPGEQQQPNHTESAGTFLGKRLRYHRDHSRRMKISQALFEGLNKNGPLTMNEMFEFSNKRIRNGIPNIEIKKYINTLFTGNAFEATDTDMQGPLLARPFRLQEYVHNPEILDQVYIQRISEILQSRYPSLNVSEILELLV